DRQIRPCTLDPRDKIKSILIRHHNVRDDEIALALLHPTPKRCCIAGCPHVVANPAKSLIEDGAYRRIIIRQQNGAARHETLSPNTPLSWWSRRPYAWARER